MVKVVELFDRVFSQHSSNAENMVKPIDPVLVCSNSHVVISRQRRDLDCPVCGNIPLPIDVCVLEANG